MQGPKTKTTNKPAANFEYVNGALEIIKRFYIVLLLPAIVRGRPILTTRDSLHHKLQTHRRCHLQYFPCRRQLAGFLIDLEYYDVV